MNPFIYLFLYCYFILYCYIIILHAPLLLIYHLPSHLQYFYVYLLSRVMISLEFTFTWHFICELSSCSFPLRHYIIHFRVSWHSYITFVVIVTFTFNDYLLLHLYVHLLFSFTFAFNINICHLHSHFSIALYF